MTFGTHSYVLNDRYIIPISDEYYKLSQKNHDLFLQTQAYLTLVAMTYWGLNKMADILQTSNSN